MNDEDVLKLASLFYEGALSSEAWGEGLRFLAAMTSSQAASIVLWDRRQDRAIVGDQVGLPAELQRDYAAHFHTQDPGRVLANQVEIGGWYVDERDFGRAAMQRSPFYQDFLRRYELDSTMASPILRSEDVHGFLSLGSEAGRRDLAQVAADLQRVMPHIQRAVRLRLKFLELSQQQALCSEMLDRMHFPLLAVTAARSVVMANKLGTQWLEMPGNPLAGPSRHAGALTTLLKQACGALGPKRAAGLRLHKPGGADYFLTAMPLPTQTSAALQLSVPVALLLVNDPERGGRQPAGELLRQLFDLSPAEIRLVEPLLRGATLQESAGELHISHETARTQLKSIFGKLQIGRQSELHRLLGWLDAVDHRNEIAGALG